MGTSTLRNLLMTGVTEGSPTRNFDANPTNGVRAPSSSAGEALGYIYANRPFPVGATILSAKVHLFTQATSQSGSKTLSLHRLAQSVTYSKVTYATRPTIIAGSITTATKTGTITNKTEWVIDVTAQLQAVSDGDKWYGWRLASSTLDPALQVYTTQASDVNVRPFLEVTWSDAPDQPQTLSPSGNRAVSIATPILRCDYVDVSGSTVLNSIQVQINTTNVWTSPTFDSGEVTTSVPQLDLSTTSYAGLTAGASTYWRVRVKDAAGLWSAWSAGAQFSRLAKGTLTLSNPADISSPYVSEATPPIIWSLTGATQAAYQVFITVPRPTTGTWPNTPVWTSGKISGTTSSITLPSRVLTQADGDYKVIVRVWDTVTREATPGDTIYYEIIRPFNYNPDATVDGPATTTLVQVAERPKVDITWTRTTAPDYWTILRNNVVIASNLDSADVLVSGSTYTYRDHNASPQTLLTYEVRAVVNGKESATNPKPTITVRSRGIWLCDLDHANDVMIIGKEDRSFTMGEMSEITEVLGSTEVVLTTQAQRGYEGQISGTLRTGVDSTNKTAQQWKAAALRIKGNAGSVCWLTVGDMTMQVVVQNLTVFPLPNPTLGFGITFDFFQQNSLNFRPLL